MENQPIRTLFVSGDHAGFELKQFLMEENAKEPIGDFIDLGPHSTDSVDYPDQAHALAIKVLKRENSLGLLICGSGAGVCMAANKHPHIRAGVAWQPEIAALLRQHNDANVLCLPARFISNYQAWKCVEAFLSSEFEGGRHARRVGKIAAPVLEDETSGP